MFSKPPCSFISACWQIPVGVSDMHCAVRVRPTAGAAIDWGIAKNINEDDVYAFGDFLDLERLRYPVYHPTWAIPWTSVVFTTRYETGKPMCNWSLCTLCLWAHGSWPWPIAMSPASCKKTLIFVHEVTRFQPPTSGKHFPTIG